MPRPSPPSAGGDARRGGGSAALGVTGAACGKPPPPPELDDLTQLDRARTDSELASDAAADREAAAAAALTAVPVERSAHAEALSDEIARLTGEARHIVVVTTTTSSPRRPSAPTAEGRRRRAARVGRQRGRRLPPPVRIPGGAARLDRRVLHGGLHRGAGLTSPATRPTALPSPATRPPMPRRAVRRGDHRARRHLRLRHRVGALHARGQRPGGRGDGRAPRTPRGRDRDARGRAAWTAAARGRLSAADAGRQPRPMPRTSRCGWRRTARWRGARSSSRRPTPRSARSR